MYNSSHSRPSWKQLLEPKSPTGIVALSASNVPAGIPSMKNSPYEFSSTTTLTLVQLFSVIEMLETGFLDIEYSFEYTTYPSFMYRPQP